MVIIRIYNNNVAIVKDRNNREMIVIGRGIAFQKHTGDFIEESKIEKRFMFQDQSVMTRLEALIKDMPSVYLTISEEIVEMIRKESDLTLSENIYITLTDHISMSLEREKKGVILKNPLLLEIRQFYKLEYGLACKASEIIKKYLNLVISEDEIGFIALHIVNASMNQRLENTMRATQMIQDILNIVRIYYHTEFNEESLRYNRFIRHLQFLAKRVLGEHAKPSDNDFLFHLARNQFPEANQCVKLIMEHLGNRFGIKVSNAEQGFLIYHIMNVTTEKKIK